MPLLATDDRRVELREQQDLHARDRACEPCTPMAETWPSRPRTYHQVVTARQVTIPAAPRRFRRASSRSTPLGRTRVAYLRSSEVASPAPTSLDMAALEIPSACERETR